MLITDPARRIVAVNRAFSRITGYAPEEVLGRQPSSLLRSGRHEDDFYQNMWVSIEEIAFWQGEIWNRRKSGEKIRNGLMGQLGHERRRRDPELRWRFSDITQLGHLEARLHHLPTTMR